MMEEFNLIRYNESLPEILTNNDCIKKDEKIRIYNNCKKRDIVRILVRYWRFASLVAAFAAIFYLLFVSFFSEKSELTIDSSDSTCDDFYQEGTTESEEIEVSASVNKKLPIFIDETRSNINFDEYFLSAGYSDLAFIADDNVKVLVVHSHSSENISESLTVTVAGEAIVQMLNSAGIGAVHSTVLHDEQGRIGAYNRMKATVLELKDKYPDLVLVIDLHGSESGAPIQFDVGASSDFAWKENLRIVSAVCSNMNRNDITVRLLPNNLGQDNGIITLSIALGYDKADDLQGRALISELSMAIIMLFLENAPM